MKLQFPEQALGRVIGVITAVNSSSDYNCVDTIVKITFEKKNIGGIYKKPALEA